MTKLQIRKLNGDLVSYDPETIEDAREFIDGMISLFPGNQFLICEQELITRYDKDGIFSSSDEFVTVLERR